MRADSRTMSAMGTDCSWIVMLSAGAAARATSGLPAEVDQLGASGLAVSDIPKPPFVWQRNGG
jgi:hypothetical protein